MGGMDGGDETKSAKPENSAIEIKYDAGGSDASDAPPDIKPGDVLGRFTIRELLGSGGMGMVYIAHDPELDRLVAIKILKQRADGASAGARARFQREAQAMARLNHPNVVSVYDAETIGARLFVAMELVPGPTLAEWLKTLRPWPEVVDVFVQAGRGLEAAHAAGIVHRDFKPANVILGDRVRVADFGLARTVLEEGEPSRAASRLESTVTETRQRLGTPAYMAPEQRDRGVTTPASDQYAFAVALHEALRGFRPGQPPVAPARPVPAWLDKIVARALAERPEDRYPSMRELLVELGRDRRRTRRAFLAVAAVVAVAAGVVAYARGLATPPCRDADAFVEPLWDTPTQARVREAFHATGKAYADDAFVRVDATVRRRLAGLAQGRREACEATHVRHEQSEALLDLRIQCLGRVRDSAQQVIDLLGHIDGKSLERAVSAVESLANPLPCADVAALGSAVPPPLDPAAVRDDGVLRLEADRANALLRLGRFKESVDAARALVERARGVPYAPTRVAVLRAAAQIESLAGDTERAIALCYEGVEAAELAHDDGSRSEILGRLFFMVGYMKDRHAEADVLDRMARGAVGRAGERADLLQNLLHNEVALATAEGDFAGALWRTLAEYGLAIRLNGWPSWLVALALGSIAEQEKNLGQLEAALHTAGASVRVAEAALGPEHPLIVMRLNVEGQVALHIHALPVADESLSRALALAERSYGPEHPLVTSILISLSGLRSQEGRPEEARQLVLRALAIIRAAGGEPRKNLFAGEEHLAIAEARLGHLGDARAELEALDGEMRRANGNDEREVSEIDAELADLERQDGQPAAALARFDAVIPKLEHALGPNHPEVVESRIGRAGALAALGRTREAAQLCDENVARLGEGATAEVLDICADVYARAGNLRAGLEVAERAERRAEAPLVDPRVIAVARLRHAELVATSDEASACALARDARHRAAGAAYVPEVPAMDRLLERHGCR